MEESELNRACKPDENDTEQIPEPEHVHRTGMNPAHEPVHAQAPAAAPLDLEQELGGLRQHQYLTRAKD